MGVKNSLKEKKKRTSHKLSYSKMEQMICLLLFRLGGEQVFTHDEIREIENTIGSVTMKIEKRKMLLRCRTKDSAIPTE